MTVFTTLSFIQVSRQLRNQNQRQLQQAVKAEGLAIYERLTILDAELQMVSLRIQRGHPLPLAAAAPHFQKLVVWDRQHGSDVDSFSNLTAPENSHLLTGGSLIRMDSCSSSTEAKCVVIARMIDLQNPKLGMIVGEVDFNYLWSADRLPSGTDLIVLDSEKHMLYRTPADGVSPPNLPALANASGFFEWQAPGRVYDAAYRDLFLKAEFFAGNWTVILSQNHSDAFAPMQHFRETLLLVALLALWIVIFFSLIQIRRTMDPLEKLGEGTKQIAAQNFDARVEISSGDEFEDLGASFNSMSSRLERQFHTLRAINDIDQAILSSLNRDAVVETALSRMANLLPSDCFAIAIFQPTSSGGFSAQVAVRERLASQLTKHPDRTASPIELQQLSNQRSLHLVLHPADAPDFLRPLGRLGMTSVFLFPILLDCKPFAALVCGSLTVAPMSEEDIQHATQVADQLAVAFSNVQLVEAMEQVHWGTLTALARAIDAKSAWTSGHSERVTEIALRIGRAMGLSPQDLRIMHRGGLLHDIGKIGIAPKVLDKPGKLDPEEMQHMREHVRMGIRILEPISAFAEALPIVAQHHEWFNGGGYPEGLAGDSISLHARIFAVADCYDAIVSDRPYRKGLPKQQVVEILRAGSGVQFDPRVVEVFLRMCAEDGTLGTQRDDSQLVEQVV